MTTLSPMVGWRLPTSLPVPAEGHALIKRHIVADDRRFADDHAVAMVDEKALADARAG